MPKQHLPFQYNLVILNGLLCSKREAIGQTVGNQAPATELEILRSSLLISAHKSVHVQLLALGIYMKVSILITISVGGLVHPVSQKNKGVDSQTQVDESRKAELVTPQLFFALQGLPLPGPGRLSSMASSPKQPEAAEQGMRPTPHGLCVALTQASSMLHLPGCTFFPCSAIRSP